MQTPHPVSFANLASSFNDPNCEAFPVVSVERIEGEFPTYDLSVEGNNEFAIGNGLLVHNTAELALGSPYDKEYLQCKDPDLHQDLLNEWRWASNNSVNILEQGHDYHELGAQTAKNGEPGYVWLDNMRKYGRLKDGVNNIDHRVAGCNPCLVADTKVAVADDRNHIRIDELKDGDLVYCRDNNGDLKVSPIRNPRITGFNQDIYEVALDSGAKIRCTGNHKFLTKNFGYVEALKLKEGDSLDLLTRYNQPDGRTASYADKYKSTTYHAVSNYEHTLVSEYVMGREKGKGEHVHHIDGDRMNNSPENLEMVKGAEHLSNHSQGSKNGNAIGVSNDQLFRHGKSICKKLGRRFSVDEWRDYATKNNLPAFFTNYRLAKLGEINVFAKRCANAVGIDLPDLDPRTLRFYLEVQNQGYDTFIEDGAVYVNKICEHCLTSFPIKAQRREQMICGQVCGNKVRDYSANKEGQKKTFDARRESNRQLQVEIFSTLKFDLGRDPQKKEWMSACKEKGVTAEISRKSSPFKAYKELKEASTVFNHKVVSVTLVGKEDVWNGTVENHHNFFVHCEDEITKGDRRKSCYINNLQCGEQSLESYELCNLVETFPSHHDSLEEYKKTLKYAYLYAKTVTLIPTHNERTNAILLRNRRIGLSQSGIVESFQKLGKREHFNWCDQGYEYITQLDQKYSDWFCVPISNKRTSVKPSGSTSLLPGVTPGIHYAHSEYYYRTIRIDKTSPLLPALKKAGIKLEDSVYGDNTKIAYFPVYEANFDKSKDEVSIWEQVENVVAMQHYWADNQVSATVTFTKEEAKDIPAILELNEDKLKSISFLPIFDHQYEQAPYQKISKEEYDRVVKKMKPLDFSNINTDEIIEKFCDSDKCEIPIDLFDKKSSE